MQTAYVVTGTLWKDEIELDEELSQNEVRVRVTVEILGPVEDDTSESLQDVIREIHEDQRRRGHVPPTPEEVEAYMKESRGG